MDMKVARAERLFMGELSAARQVLKSADSALGNSPIHRALTWQDRRPVLLVNLRPGIDGEGPRTTILVRR